VRAAEDAVRRDLGYPNLELSGAHCHIGSQTRQVASFELVARRIVDLIARLRREHDATIGELDLGGGHAVPYLPGDEEVDLAVFANRLRAAVLRVPGPPGADSPTGHRARPAGRSSRPHA
jgi:diaminopimelate decarboxylase